MSRSRPSRRRVLVTGAASASLLLAGSWVPTGCTSPARAPDGPDPLESPARQAEADVTLAQAVAQMAERSVDHAGSVLAAAATALAVDRMAHATTLRAELRRVQPRPVPSHAAPPAVSPPVAPAYSDLAGARAALIQAVRAAQDEAADLVATLPGYRAALLASVAACCATHAALLS